MRVVGLHNQCTPLLYASLGHSLLAAALEEHGSARRAFELSSELTCCLCRLCPIGAPLRAVSPGVGSTLVTARLRLRAFVSGFDSGAEYSCEEYYFEDACLLLMDRPCMGIRIDTSLHNSITINNITNKNKKNNNTNNNTKVR